MSLDRRRLIRSLVDDLEPVTRPGRTVHLLAAWFAGSCLYVASIVSLTGDWRAGAVTGLPATPQLGLEIVTGLLAAGLLAAGALALAVPGRGNVLRDIALPLAVTAAWLAIAGYALLAPATDPSMLGKREHCWVETLLFAVPPLLAGVVVVRRLYALHPAWSGLQLGLAAGALPAVAMQLACMYAPVHALTHHVGPGLAMGLVGAGLGAWLARPGHRARHVGQATRRKPH